jgi:hypothetical protein
METGCDDTGFITSYIPTLERQIIPFQLTPGQNPLYGGIHSRHIVGASEMEERSRP